MHDHEKKKQFAEAKEAIRRSLLDDPMVSHAELAQRHNLARSTVSMWARKMGFDGHRKEKLVSKIKPLIEVIWARLAEQPDIEYKALAAELGVRQNFVSYWARRRDGAEARKKFATAQDHARWVQMFQRGLSIGRIAQVSGFSADTVAKALREKGLDTSLSRKAHLYQQALELAEAEGISKAKAAFRVGVTPSQLANYELRKRKQENKNADIVQHHRRASAIRRD